MRGYVGFAGETGFSRDGGCSEPARGGNAKVEEGENMKALRLWFLLNVIYPLTSERRICPSCVGNELDAVSAIFAKRKRYLGHCPKCGKFWT
jgi:hypothetical protein